MQGPTPSGTPSPPSLTQEKNPICDNPTPSPPETSIRKLSPCQTYATTLPSSSPVQNPANSSDPAASRLAASAPLPPGSSLRFMQVGSGPASPPAPQASFPYFLTPMDVANYVLKNPLPMYCRLANNGNRSPDNNGSLPNQATLVSRLTLPSSASTSVASRQNAPTDRRGFPAKPLTSLGPRGPLNSASLVNVPGNRQFMRSPPVPLAWLGTRVAPSREWPGLGSPNSWSRHVTPSLSSVASRRQLQGAGEVDYLWPEASKGNAYRIPGSGRRPNSGPPTTSANNATSPPAGNGLREGRPIVPSNSASGAGVSEMVERGQNMASLAANIGVDSRVDWVTSVAETGPAAPGGCNIPEKYFGVSFNAPAGGAVSGSPRTLTPAPNPSFEEANLPVEINGWNGDDLSEYKKPAASSLSVAKEPSDSPLATPSTAPPPAGNADSGHSRCASPESQVFEDSSEPDGDAPTPRPDIIDELDGPSSGKKAGDEVLNTVNSCKVQSSVRCKHELTMISVHGPYSGEDSETSDGVFTSGTPAVQPEHTPSTQEPPPAAAAPRASRKRKAAESAELRILSYQIEEAPRPRRARQRPAGRVSKLLPAPSSQPIADPSGEPCSVFDEPSACIGTEKPAGPVPAEASPQFDWERKPSFFGFDAGDPSCSEIAALSRIWYKSKWKLLDLHLRHVLGELQDCCLGPNAGSPLQRYVCVFGDAPVPGELLRESGLQKVGRQRRILTVSSGHHPLQGSSLFGFERPAIWSNLDDHSTLLGTNKKAGSRSHHPSHIPYPRRRSLDCLSSDEIMEARTLDLMLIGSKADSEFLHEIYVARKLGVVPAETLVSRPFFYPTEVYEPASRRLHSPADSFSRQQTFSGTSSKPTARKPANAPSRKPACSTNRRKPNQASSRLLTGSLDASVASHPATAALRRTSQRSSEVADSVLIEEAEGHSFRLSPIWDGSSSSWIVQWDVNGQRLTNSFFADASDTIDQAQKKAEADIFCRSLEFARRTYLNYLRNALHESSVTSYVRAKPFKKAPAPAALEPPVKGEVEIDQDCIDLAVKDQPSDANSLKLCESPELPTPSTAPESPPFLQSTGYPGNALNNRSRKRKPSYTSTGSKKRCYRNLSDRDVAETLKLEDSNPEPVVKSEPANKVLRTATFTGAVFESLQEILDWIAVLEKLESILLKQTTVWKECLGADLNSCGLGQIRWGGTLVCDKDLEERRPESLMTQCLEIREDLYAVGHALLPETETVIPQVAGSESAKGSTLFEGGLMASKIDSMVDRIGLLGDYLQSLRLRREPKKKRRKVEDWKHEVAGEPARRQALEFLRSPWPLSRSRADQKWKRYTVVPRKRAGPVKSGALAAEGAGAVARPAGKVAAGRLQESPAVAKRRPNEPTSPVSEVSTPRTKAGETATTPPCPSPAGSREALSPFPTSAALAESGEMASNDSSGKTLVRKNVGSNIRGPMAGRRLPPEGPLSERYSQQRRSNSPPFVRQSPGAGRRGSVASHRPGTFRTAMVPRAPSDSPPRRPPPVSQEEDCTVGKSRVGRSNPHGRHGGGESTFEEGLRRRVQILSVMAPVLSSRRGAEKAWCGRTEGRDCIGELP